MRRLAPGELLAVYLLISVSTALMGAAIQRHDRDEATRTAFWCGMAEAAEILKSNETETAPVIGRMRIVCAGPRKIAEVDRIERERP